MSGDARVSGDDDVITARPLSSTGEAGACYRTADGHEVVIGCWRGTTADLRALVASDDWPSRADEATRARYAPRLLTWADLCDAQIALWAVRP